jgi:hypothetical protein
MEWYRTAVLQRPHYDCFWFGYAFLAAKNGNADEALQCLMMIVKENSSYMNQIPPLITVASGRAGWTKQKLIDEITIVGPAPALLDYVDKHWDAQT